MRIDNCVLLWLIALRANARYAYERYIYIIYTPHVRNIHYMCKVSYLYHYCQIFGIKKLLCYARYAHFGHETHHKGPVY